MSKTAVAERPAGLPDLIRTPALEIGADDIALPRVYIGQYMSKAVQEQLVKAGDIFAASGSDDPDPNVLSAEGSEDGVVFHVLALRKGKSLSEDGGPLQMFDYDDPSAPAEAWVTYSYTIAIPSVDEDVPFKLLLTRTGRTAALKMNTILKKNQILGPAYANAFRLTTAKRENQKGKFYVAQISGVEAVEANVKVAEKLAVQMSATAIEHNASGELPAI